MATALDPASDKDEVSVSTLELFFDLVFVFTLTQLTALLADDPTVEGGIRVLLIFTVVYWMYGGYVWLTNRVPPDRTVRRLLMILGMGAFLVCALAIPTAFDGGGVVFGLGYLLVVVVHGGLYAQAFGRAVVARFVPMNIATALSVTVAAFVPLPAAYGLWGIALVIQFATQALASGAASRFDINAGHFVERHGLLLIVALGESVVAVGIGVGDLPLDAGVVGAALLGLALSSALWWSYFVGDEESAERTMTAGSPEERFRMAIFGFFYAFVAMLLGIVTIAAGVKKSLGHIGETLELGSAMALGGGVALYLVGDAVFRWIFRIDPRWPRVVAAVLALLSVLVGLYVGAGVQLVVLVAVLVGTLTLEHRRGR